MSALYKVFYPALLQVFRLLLRFAPVETFNRLCAILPARMVSEGLRYYGASIGKGVTITPPIIFHNFNDKSRKPFANLSIADYTYIGRSAFFDLKDQITIEERATLAMEVMIITHTDSENSPLAAKVLPNSTGPVIIRTGAYIGARATILEGVEIGECAIAAAGALVIKSIPPYTVYGGVPARLIRAIPPEL